MEKEKLMFWPDTMERRPPSLLFQKKAGADIIVTSREIQHKIQRLKERTGDEYTIVGYRQESKRVDTKINILKNNAFTGFILVMAVLFLFLPKGIGVATSLSLPLAIMGTLGLMASLGVNLNAVTILALVIVLGMLVDNAVVISENYTRLRAEGKLPGDAVLTSIATLWPPLTVTSLTTIAAFLPMLLTKGIMGQFIKWIPIIVTLALFFGLAESFFLLPMRLVSLGKSGNKRGIVNKFHNLEQRFERFVLWCIHKRYLVGCSLVAVMVFSFFLMTKINTFKPLSR